MTVLNRQREALTSDMTLDQFGKAMAALDLEGVPPEKRAKAIFDHLAMIMACEIHDKDKARDLVSARILSGAISQ